MTPGEVGPTRSYHPLHMYVNLKFVSIFKRKWQQPRSVSLITRALESISSKLKCINYHFTTNMVAYCFPGSRGLFFLSRALAVVWYGRTTLLGKENTCSEFGNQSVNLLVRTRARQRVRNWYTGRAFLTPAARECRRTEEEEEDIVGKR